MTITAEPGKTASIDEQAEAAMRRLREWIARSAGQHKRAIRAKFRQAAKRV